MSFLRIRVGTFALASAALACQACISKGDTVINGEEEEKPRVQENKDSGAGPSSSTDDEDDSAPDDTDDDPVDTDDDSTDESTPPSPTTPENEPEPNADDEPEPAPPGEDPVDTPTEPTDTPAAEPVVCAKGLTPTKSEPVQLTTSAANKSGLRVLQTDAGYALSWVQSNLTLTNLAYQMFDTDFEPNFDQKLVPDLDDAKHHALTATEDEILTAYDHSGSLWVARWNPANGMLNDTINTDVSSAGSAVYAHFLSGRLFIATMVGGSGCGVTRRINASFFNIDSEAGVDPYPSGGCILDPLSVFVANETTVGLLMPGYQGAAGRFDYLVATTAMPASGAAVDSKVNVNQGALFARAKDLYTAVVVQGPGVRYARLQDDGSVFDDPVDITVSGTPTALAFTDSAAGVLVESQGTLSFFARAIGDDELDSYHPVGVVAAQKGLKESTLGTRDGQFVAFFLAEDDSGKTQAFASEIRCVP